MFLLLLLSVFSPNLMAVEHVAVIELNHFFDQRGKPVFSQVVFYERSPETGRFQVRAWCLVEDREELGRRPIRNETTGVYTVYWLDKDRKLQRKITSSIYSESWTQVDTEVANKLIHPQSKRIALVHKLNNCQIDLPPVDSGARVPTDMPPDPPM